jgi:hypothetical protein
MGAVSGVESAAGSLMSIETYETRVTRTNNPDGTITETTDYIDRRSKAVVRKVIRHFFGDGVTPFLGTEIWFDGPVPTRIVFEKYDGGVLVEKKTWDYDRNGDVTGKTIDEYEGGELRRRTLYGPEPDYEVLGTFDYGYDRSGRLIRITERDGKGKVKKVTTYDYLTDGSHSVTVTDYSHDPARVTRTEYDTHGVPK